MILDTFNPRPTLPSSLWNEELYVKGAGGIQLWKDILSVLPKVEQ